MLDGWVMCKKEGSLRDRVDEGIGEPIKTTLSMRPKAWRSAKERRQEYITLNG